LARKELIDHPAWELILSQAKQLHLFQLPEIALCLTLGAPSEEVLHFKPILKALRVESPQILLEDGYRAPSQMARRQELS